MVRARGEGAVTRALAAAIAVALAGAPLAAQAATPQPGRPPGPAAPAERRDARSPDGSPSVLFSADQLTRYEDTGVVVASGNVEVTYGEQILLADTLTYNEREDTLTASGSVRYLQPNGDVMFAEYMRLSSDFKDGTARNMMLLMSDRSRAAAVAGTRTGGRYTRLYKAVYSACLPCEDDPERPPVWQIKAAEVQHDAVREQVEYKDARLEFLGVPVLYTPYLSHPDPRRKRESGFLMPSYGNNSDLGVFLQTPYYWNIAPHKDLTFEPIWYLEHTQPVLAGEYRHNTPRGGFDTYVSGTYITEDNRTGGTSPGMSEFRGHVETEGRFDIDDTWRWGFDLNRATDDTYMRRYGFGSQSHLASRVYAEGFRPRSYAEANLFGYQNLRDDREDDEVADAATFLAYNHRSQPGPYGSSTLLNASLMGVQRFESTDTRRLAVHAGWSLDHVAPAGDIYDFEVSLLGQAYHVDNQPVPGRASAFDGTIARALPQASLVWRYPFKRAHGRSMEVLEPIVGLFAAPNVGSDERIPNEDSQDFEFDDTSLFVANRFAGMDRLEGGQRVDYGLRWGAYGLGGGSTHAFIGQSYRLRADDTFARGSGLEGNFSDVVGRISVNPGPFVEALYRFRLAREDLEPIQNELAGSIGPASLKLNLRYTLLGSSADTSGFGEREEIYAGIHSRLTRYWTGSVSAQRRLSEPSGMQTAGFALQYLDDCFQFDASFRRSYYSDRDIRPNDTIMFRLVFRNLGEFTAPVF